MSTPSQERRLSGEELSAEALSVEALSDKVRREEALPGEVLPGEVLSGEALPGEALSAEEFRSTVCRRIQRTAVPGGILDPGLENRPAPGQHKGTACKEQEDR